jgi:ferric iron reductase protein FhuF
VAPGGSWTDAARLGRAVVLDAVVRPVITPVLNAYRASFALSRQVLWGNVASALSGAATGLGAPTAHLLVRDLLELGELAGTARAVWPRFVRNSCCLFYRLPGGGLCGDCVLRANDG